MCFTLEQYEDPEFPPSVPLTPFPSLPLPLPIIPNPLLQSPHSESLIQYNPPRRQLLNINPSLLRKLSQKTNTILNCCYSFFFISSSGYSMKQIIVQHSQKPGPLDLDGMGRIARVSALIPALCTFFDIENLCPRLNESTYSRVSKDARTRRFQLVCFP